MGLYPEIEGYDLLGLLGKGGVGEVYEAHDRARGETVALKLLIGVKDAPPEERVRFEREFQFLQQLQHPVLPRVYDCSEHNGIPYFTMERLQGQALDDFLDEEGRVPLRWIGPIFAQLLSALAYIHSLGVVHRDLKPPNVLLQQDGTPRLFDFGIARQLSQVHLTRSGIILGTPKYMSPEQLCGEEVDERSDLYSLGVILYQCLTGKPPFDTRDIPKLLNQILNVIPEPLPDTLDPRLNTLTLQLLSKQKAARPATAVEALETWKSIYPTAHP